MLPRIRVSRTPARTRSCSATTLYILVAALCLAASVFAQTYHNDFTSYPASTKVCLEKAALNSTCTGRTHEEMNSCLCLGTGVNSFPVLAAVCIGRVGPGDLSATYLLLKADCESTKSPLAIYRSNFIQAAFDSGSSFISTAATSQVPTIALPSTAPSRTIKPSSIPAGAAVSPADSATAEVETTDQSGLSMVAKTGIIAACVVVGSILGAVITYLVLARRKKNRPARNDGEKRPILIPPGASMSTLAFGYGAGQHTPTTMGGTTMVASPHEWHMTSQQQQQQQQQQAVAAGRRPSTRSGNMQPAMPSPMSTQGQWVLDRATGTYILADAAAMSPRRAPQPPLPQQHHHHQPPPLPRQTPRMPTFVPVEAPGTEVPLEMPSNPTAVPTWVRQHQQEPTVMPTAHQPRPLRTSAVYAQNGRSDDDSPSSVYSQSTVQMPAMPPVPDEANVASPGEVYSAQDKGRQPPATWV